MSSVANAFLTLKLHSYARDCRAAESHVRHARTLQELMHACRVHADPVVAPMARQLPEARALKFAAQRRAMELAQAQLDTAVRMLREKGEEAYRSELGRLRHREWVFLRGDWASVLGQLERLAMQALSQHKRARQPEAPKPEPPAQ